MKILEVVGPFKGISGYDKHTREFVRQFVNMNLTVQLRELVGWSPPMLTERQDPLFSSLVNSINASMVLHFTMPHQAHAIPRKQNVNYTMFECSSIPQDWVYRSMNQDLIVMPTESSRLAWLNSGVPEEKLRICPLGVDGSFFSKEAEPLSVKNEQDQNISTYKHRFLNIAELRPRKNHLGLLRSWIQATIPEDEAILIIKGTVFQERALSQFQQDVIEMQQNLGQTLSDAAPVVFIHGFLSDVEILSLYKTATHYISMSKGEGWDQVMFEAATSGLKVIAPQHSAYTSYLKEEDTEFISSRLTPAIFEGRVSNEDRIFFDGLSWWTPDEQEAAKIIHGVINGKKATKPSPGKRLAKEYTWENAGKILLGILEEL